ncbi:MAG: hypothetical protein JRI50_09930, partial [Deltaproteobacteria bacterium]|nr:hypothetical protein [Deltaproteobacteria bacterium]
MSYRAKIIPTLLTLLSLGACVPGPQGGQRLNLAPLVFYSHDPQDEVTRLELLGPLFSREQTPAVTTTVTPLFCWQSW